MTSLPSSAVNTGHGLNVVETVCFCRFFFGSDFISENAVALEILCVCVCKPEILSLGNIVRKVT